MSSIVRSQHGRGDVLAHVSSNLRRLRKARKLSQEALAKASGLSRRLIVNLEAGNTNISLSSLDRLAEALESDFVAMVADPETGSRRIEAVVWRGVHVSSEASLLASVPATREAQLWRWSLAPGERYDAEPDPTGWHEMVTVTAGCIRIDKQDGSVTIKAGDFVIYSSAQSYAYANAGAEVASFVRVVVS